MRQPSSVKRVAPVVQGPIKCHKCQTKCADAASYLSHTCETLSRVDEAQLRKVALGRASGL